MSVCPNCGYNDENDFLKDYQVSEESRSLPGIKRAEPIVSEYRERFKSRKIRPSELVAQPKVYNKVGQVNAEMSKFGDLVIGEGLQQEY